MKGKNLPEIYEDSDLTVILTLKEKHTEKTTFNIWTCPRQHYNLYLLKYMKQNKSVSTQQIMQPKATLFSHLINKKVFFYVKVKNIVFSHFPDVTWEYCEPILLFGGQILFYLQHFLYQKI